MATFDLASLVRPELASLTAYSPDLHEYEIRLDANEAPRLLGHDVLARLAHAASEVAWTRYPDPTAAELRRAIATRVGAAPDEIVVGAGSDELIGLLVTVLSRQRGSAPPTVLTVAPTFVMYRQNALARGLRIVEIPLDDDWDLPSAALDRAIEQTMPNLIFIASPNNPTANLVDPARLEHLIERASGALVVIDEAYIDYASRDQLSLFRRHPNVAILRTLSKIGFAALRVGYLLASRELATDLDKARSPFNVPTASQRVATMVLTDLAPEIAATVRTVVAERQRVARGLGELGLALSKSEANFLWLQTPLPAADVLSELGKRGIVVRSFHQRGGRLADRLRVTVGTAAENDRFLQAMREILGRQ